MAPLTDEQFEDQAREAMADALAAWPLRILCSVGALVVAGCLIGCLWTIAHLSFGVVKWDLFLSATCLLIYLPRPGFELGRAAITGRTNELAQSFLPRGAYRRFPTREVRR
ncbi:hypothetical protein [Alienimonas chondri]|uniref:Uncharacterized protein n=1 Tax=Alienimonas chondri TaxID=2681879 RepID=A0ABX1VHV0_9PLAN|nr:hypothetical protein [Alienimonas chondri]NNJ26822.1 hypothetical protein [Alienimonas chondri]